MGREKMQVKEIEEEETLLGRSSSSLLSMSSLDESSSSSSSLDDSSSSSSSSCNEDGCTTKEMPLLALNHVSYVCKSLRTSVKFYEDVLGFVLIKRPSSFDFEGAWLFNHGIGIHLLEAEHAQGKGDKKINPKDNHISFQCTNMEVIMQNLKEMKIEFVTAVVKEGGITVDQLFFHDPDGYMIEICNCQNLPVLPISSCPLKKMSMSTPMDASSSSYVKPTSKNLCSEALMMDYFTIDMMNICY